MTNKDSEMILAFNKEALEKIDLIQDMLKVDVLAPTTLDDHAAMINTLNNLWDIAGVVGRRGDLEENFGFVQPIPSVVVKRGNEYFAYTRLEGSGEERLHNMSSLTLGGHANDIKYAWNFEHLMAVNTARELEEEVYILDESGEEIKNHYELSKELTVLGLGYTDKTDVDSVHLAIFSLLVIPENWDIKVKETDTLKGKFETIDEIKKMNLENWSKMALNVLT